MKHITFKIQLLCQLMADEGHIKKNDREWMLDAKGEYIDIHEELRPYSDVFSFMLRVQQEYDLKKYCNGFNQRGRWIFQIYSFEFIRELASLINELLNKNPNSELVLEVMAGDGRLSEFLRPILTSDIKSTDSKSDRYGIVHPKCVEELDATKAVEKYQPDLVLLSWEPYLSEKGVEIVQRGVPMIWIGNPLMCGRPSLFEHDYKQIRSRYLLSRHDSFLKKEFKSGLYLFNEHNMS